MFVRIRRLRRAGRRLPEHEPRRAGDELVGDLQSIGGRFELHAPLANKGPIAVLYDAHLVGVEAGTGGMRIRGYEEHNGAAVLQEWAGWQSHPAWNDSPRVETVYFGGGTPSRLDPSALGDLLGGLADAREIVSDAEITLEANPDDVTPSAAQAWRAAGVNRVSLGAQSFDPSVLAWMHRTHTAEQSSQAVELLRAGGMPQISLDLIYALPAELNRDWHRDLEQALALAPDHLSLYGLTVEQHTPLFRWVNRGETNPAPEESYAVEFLMAHELLTRNGFHHYEVSNYARPARQSRHNRAYWSERAYAGLGPAAHSFSGAERRWNLEAWSAYERALDANRDPTGGRERLSEESRRTEWLYLGLRTSAGIPRDRWCPPATAVERAWFAAGWVRDAGQAIRLTPEGWLRLDEIVAVLTTSARPERSSG